MQDLPSKHKQQGFNTIELLQILLLIAFIADLGLLVKGSVFGVPLAYLLASFIAGIIVVDKTARNALVLGQRVGRILFVVCVVLFAPVIWWLHSLIAVFVCTAISYAVATQLGRLWPNKAAQP